MTEVLMSILTLPDCLNQSGNIVDLNSVLTRVIWTADRRV